MGIFGAASLNPLFKLHRFLYTYAMRLRVAMLSWLSLAVFTSPAGAYSQATASLVPQAPVTIAQVAPGVLLADFGRVAFGNLLLHCPIESRAAALTIRLGESLDNGRVNIHPPGSVRYAEVRALCKPGTTIRVAPLPDKRNTSGEAVLTPPEWGVLMPFRWVEIEGWPGTLRVSDIRRQASFDSTWNDQAASFYSSNEMLNRIWELSHYSIKATTFAGVFVDGDRERTAYEGDAYLTQLGYYSGDATGPMPRATFDRLVTHPTWPSEWAPHMVFMAYADWMQTGDKKWLEDHCEVLKSKLLSERVGPDGLVISSETDMHRNDLVDWPQGERDHFVFTPINTVVNAFRLRALLDMADLANALGKTGEAASFRQQEERAQVTFQSLLFDRGLGLYRDGEGTTHSSLHANLFPLAFGLVPLEERPHVAQWLAARGMACSVYGAQYLLEALFENGQSDAAIALMTAPGDRSWRHMVDEGATITWEAWDQKYKPNQDWNHAWGAAPANLLPRFVLGSQPLTPGWRDVGIQPHPDGLTYAMGRVPTPLGTLTVSWKREGKQFTMDLELPKGMNAKVQLPALPGSTGVWMNGKRVDSVHQDSWWIVNTEVSGKVSIAER